MLTAALTRFSYPLLPMYLPQYDFLDQKLIFSPEKQEVVRSGMDESAFFGARVQLVSSLFHF